MAGPAVIEAAHEAEIAHRVSFDLAELTRMYDFTGRTVAITGGAGILGSEIASALAGCGAQVAILDVNPEAGKAAVDRMGEHGKQRVGLPVRRAQPRQRGARPPRKSPAALASWIAW